MNRKQRKPTKFTRSKFLIIGIAVVIIAIGGIMAINAQNPLFQPTRNSRVVFWRHVHGLGIDPSDPSILYIATHGDFYHSINGGPPIKVDRDRADYMAFNAPTSKGIPLYASGHPSTGGNTGLIRSTDGGRTWERVSNVLDPPVDFHAMAVSKSSPNIILGFDSAGRGLFKTVDSGKTWTLLPHPDSITALAISPRDSELVFAGTEKGLFKSTDGGKNWIRLEEYKQSYVLAVAFDDYGAMYVSSSSGLSRSTNLGITWERIDTPDLTVTSVAVDSVNRILYVAGYSSKGYQEVYKSSTEGRSWDLIATNRDH